MNKAVMIPIQPKFSKMIKDGLKKFEFRNYAIPKGTIVYLYESLGKSKRVLNDSLRGYIKSSDYKKVHEGQGKVVAEFVVGDCWETQFELNPLLDYEEKVINFYTTILNEVGKIAPIQKNMVELMKIGYWHETYAMEITDLIVYDEEWQNYIMEDSEFDDKYYADYWTKLEDAPTEPLDISEFYSWNKLIKLVKVEASGFAKKITQKRCEEVLDKHMGLYKHPTLASKGTKDCKLTHAPQGKVYVVERD